MGTAVGWKKSGMKKAWKGRGAQPRGWGSTSNNRGTEKKANTHGRKREVSSQIGATKEELPPSKDQLQEVTRERILKKRTKLAKLHSKRKEAFIRDRQNADAALRTAPAGLLWKLYSEWAGDKLTKVEADAEQWNDQQVVGASLGPRESLLDVIRSAVPSALEQPKELAEGNVPSVACIAISLSAVRAVAVAKQVYDGAPVGKLFSKHISVDEQRGWLNKMSRKGPIKCAVGTSKRLHVLCEKGFLTLDNTNIIVLDFFRDSKRQSLIDIRQVREELFEFIHDFVRPRLRDNKLKLLVVVPENNGNERQILDSSGAGD